MDDAFDLKQQYEILPAIIPYLFSVATYAQHQIIREIAGCDTTQQRVLYRLSCHRHTFIICYTNIGEKVFVNNAYLKVMADFFNNLAHIFLT